MYVDATVNQMKKKLILSKQILRNLTDDKLTLVSGGGSLNCTNPTSTPLVAGCFVRESNHRNC